MECTLNQLTPTQHTNPLPSLVSCFLLFFSHEGMCSLFIFSCFWSLPFMCTQLTEYTHSIALLNSFVMPLVSFPFPSYWLDHLAFTFMQYLQDCSYWSTLTQLPKHRHSIPPRRNSMPFREEELMFVAPHFTPRFLTVNNY